MATRSSATGGSPPRRLPASSSPSPLSSSSKRHPRRERRPRLAEAWALQWCLGSPPARRVWRRRQRRPPPARQGPRRGHPTLAWRLACRLWARRAAGAHSRQHRPLLPALFRLWAAGRPCRQQRRPRRRPLLLLRFRQSAMARPCRLWLAPAGRHCCHRWPPSARRRPRCLLWQEEQRGRRCRPSERRRPPCLPWQARPSRCPPRQRLAGPSVCATSP